MSGITRLRNPRQYDERYLNFIRDLECATCGNDVNVEAAHLRRASHEWLKPLPGTGAKPDDCWTAPLCSKCHQEQHHVGEPAFWSRYRIDAFLLCAKLQLSYPDGDRALHHLRWARTTGRKSYGG